MLPLSVSSLDRRIHCFLNPKLSLFPFFFLWNLSVFASSEYFNPPMWWLGVIYLIKPLLCSSVYMSNIIVFYRAYTNKPLLCPIVSALGQKSTNEVLSFPSWTSPTCHSVCIDCMKNMFLWKQSKDSFLWPKNKQLPFCKGTGHLFLWV